MVGNLKNAEFCLNEAKRLRSLASVCTFADIRQELLAIASDYDALARRFLEDCEGDASSADRSHPQVTREAESTDC